jgi:diadenosine tetraphosphate (Ap4A) HIT family hydrolase
MHFNFVPRGVGDANYIGVAAETRVLAVRLAVGAAAGGSQSDHLHVHCVPRWEGDANFIAVAAETRVLPVGLAEAGERLRAAWPG